MLEKLCLFKSFDLTLKIDSKLVFQGKSISIAICNGRGDGKFFPYNQGGGLQDNTLGIMVAGDISSLKRVEFLHKILINKTKNLKKVHFFQGSQIQLNLKKNNQTSFLFFRLMENQ